MKGSLVRFIYPNIFGPQEFDMYGKNRFGLDRSDQFMSGHVRMQYSLPKILDLKIFMIQNILGDQKILLPNSFWTQNHLGINFF